MLAGDGERLDHLLSALLLLALPRATRASSSTRSSERLASTSSAAQRTLEGEPGELVSLLPLHGPAEGVTTEGLAYPLAEETLEAGSSRGVSQRVRRRGGTHRGSSAACSSPCARPEGNAK